MVRSHRRPKAGALELWNEAAATYGLRGCSPYYPPQAVVGAAPVMPLNVHDQAVAGTWSMSCSKVY